jgi:isopentenyl phosphate kinase
MKPLYILKLGGSVVTHKNRQGVSVRKILLKEVADELKKIIAKKAFNLILIHGAGAFGHQLAHKYNLREGVKNDPVKSYGSLLSRIGNQKLNTAITEILVDNGLKITPMHTASVIIQKDKKIVSCNLEVIQEALRQNYVPLLYGEMVFDQALGMTICSGDAIAPYLAKKLKAEKIFFASDIDGIFTKDPHLHRDAKLLKKIALEDIEKNANLAGSHNVDVTDGLLGKIKKLDISKNKTLKSVEIFNGLHAENYAKIFLKEEFPHTKIYIKNAAINDDRG